MIPMKEFLKYVDISELHNKICHFRELDFKKLNYKEVQKEISNVISFNTPKGNCALLVPTNSTYPEKTRFYRVRNIDEGDRTLPLKSMSTVNDCWEPPKNVVKPGRLNRQHEPLLYTSPINATIAIEELKIADEQLFSLIVYEAVTPIKVTCIGVTPNIESLTKDEALKLKMIQDFLKHEFIRDVGNGTEYLYRISESITKDYFDLPPDIQDAWCYPSVAKKGGYNVCFRPNQKLKLKLVGVQIASVTRDDDDRYHFEVKVIAKDSGDGINLSYHDIGSPEQIYLFPEISPTTIQQE
ncbi:TPA: hypothetical protein ACX6PS_000859 [Photobacterium damselae]